MTEESIMAEVLGFIRSHVLFDSNAVLDKDQSLLGSGVVDSTGILELISFLQSTYSISFKDDELVADNFDTLRRIGAIVMAKSPSRGA